MFVAVVHFIGGSDDSEEEDVVILTAERSDVVQKRYVWSQTEKFVERKSYKILCEFYYSFLL